MDIKIHLLQSDKSKYYNFFCELQLITLLYFYNKSIRAIKKPWIAHFQYIKEIGGKSISGSDTDPEIYWSEDLAQFCALDTDERVKLMLKMIEEKILLLKNERLYDYDYSLFENFYQEWAPINFNKFVPVHTMEDKSEEFVVFEINLPKRAIYIALREKDKILGRLKILGGLEPPFYNVPFIKLFKLKKRKDLNIFKLRLKNILIRINLNEFRWYFEQNSKRPTSRSEKEDFLFAFTSIKGIESVNRVCSFSDEDFIAFLNNSVQENISKVPNST